MNIDQTKTPENRINGATSRDFGARNDMRVDEARSGLAARKAIHDMRNILSSAQLLSDQLSQLDDPTVRRLAPKLTASLDRATALCARTRDDEKALKGLPKRERLALAPLVDEVASTLDLDHGEISWINNVAATVEIDADSDDLFRALLNICDNAILALDGPGFRYKEIRVDGRRDGAGCTIEVRDTGLGVPKKALTHLFEASVGSTRLNGSGLGLAIAADLVRAHGGDICLVHGFAEGACFRISIPDRLAGSGIDTNAIVEKRTAVGAG